jgi:hypothetical protein
MQNKRLRFTSITVHVPTDKVEAKEIIAQVGKFLEEKHPGSIVQEHSPTWRNSELDAVIRMEIMGRICGLMRAKFEGRPELLKKIPRSATLLEHHLYFLAPTRAAYLDPTTLVRRMTVLTSQGKTEEAK